MGKTSLNPALIAIEEHAMTRIFQEILSTAQNGEGKPPARQLLEMAKLRLRKPPVGISEYFEYGIWHKSVTPAMADEFIGWRQSSLLDRHLNDDSSRVLANDKLLNYLVLRAGGYPIPESIASFTSSGRRIDRERVLTRLEDVYSFLEEDVYPFYVKPISAGYGHGVFGVSAREGDRFRLLDDSIVSREKLMAPFALPPYKGMLFQRPLTAHPEIVELTGTEAVSCIRFICFITSDRPIIHTAFWKITTGRNMLDNFSHGDYGNCLGIADVATGKITRVIARMGPGGEITQHPTTGKPLVGFQLPEWQKAKDLVCSASKEFPGLRLQNWDVSFCPEGPVLLELNTESELAVPQAISGRGLMDPALRKILADINAETDAYRAAIARQNEFR
ncbi:MAG: sugar-transfer associated ATP-grasp domain-containing protein [Propionivibrio sp.]